jgi:DNA-binding NarL/FixJ family response regulator
VEGSQVRGPPVPVPPRREVILRPYQEAPLITVLIADDHPFVRRSLADLFAATDDITVVAECADGSEVLAAALATRPEIVLMDLFMPGRTGLEATRDLLDAGLPSRVVLLTGSLSATAVREARALGVAGYLLKGDDPGKLPQRIREVAAGRSAWAGPVAAGLLPRTESRTAINRST